MASRILSFGDMLWDLFPEGPRFGGAPGNYACHAARLGGGVHMVTGVGTGERGTAALEVLKAQGVKADLVQRLEDYPTGIVTVEVDEEGKPTFEIGDDAAWDHWEWNEAIEDKVRRPPMPCASEPSVNAGNPPGRASAKLWIWPRKKVSCGCLT